MISLRRKMLGASALLALGLSACGGGASDGSNATAGSASGDAGATVTSLTLSDGPDICFQRVAKHLSADTKVYSIRSSFSKGKDLDRLGMERTAQGELTDCSVKYQNPQDPRKLVESDLDLKTGKFDDPAPVELSVFGGDPADFKLEEFLIPLGQVKTVGLKAIMDGQKATLDKAYSKYAWSSVDLVEPGMTDRTHRLRIDVSGRLASNDVLDGGYAEISTDGKKVIANNLH